MAYYERDYYAEEPRPKRDSIPFGKVGKGLAIVLGLVFFLLVGIESNLELQLAAFDGSLLPHLMLQQNALLPYSDVPDAVWPTAWQLVTAPLVETSLLSLILTGVFLCWMIGGMLEGALGAKRFLMLLVAAALGTSVISALLDPYLAGDRVIASSGMGPVSICVFTVAALLAGDARTFLNLRFATLAWILIGFNLVMVFAGFFKPDGGVVSSLSGSMVAVPMGFLSAKILQNRGVIRLGRAKRREEVEDWRAFAKRFRDDIDDDDETTQTAHKVKTEKRNRREADEKQRLDELLERIGRDGISSLSSSERAFLERMSKRKRQESRT